MGKCSGNLPLAHLQLKLPGGLGLCSKAHAKLGGALNTPGNVLTKNQKENVLSFWLAHNWKSPKSWKTKKICFPEQLHNCATAGAGHEKPSQY